MEVNKETEETEPLEDKSKPVYDDKSVISDKILILQEG